VLVCRTSSVEYRWTLRKTVAAEVGVSTLSDPDGSLEGMTVEMARWCFGRDTDEAVNSLIMVQ
jgi:hypothetical protein